MNVKTIYILLILFLSLVGCHHVDRKYYYDTSALAKIKSFKKDKNYTFISYKLPKPEKVKVREYLEKEIKYTFNKNSFYKNRTIFTLVGPNTMNFGELYKIEGNNQIRIDSIATQSQNFIFLELNPIIKGEYLIKSRGCRFSKNIVIKIE